MPSSRAELGRRPSSGRTTRTRTTAGIRALRWPFSPVRAPTPIPFLPATVDRYLAEQPHEEAVLHRFAALKLREKPPAAEDADKPATPSRD